MDSYIDEAQRTPNRMSPKRHTLRHFIGNLSKVKERILKSAREMCIIAYEGAPIRSVDFSAQTLQARREWDNIFKALKEKENKNKPTNKNHCKPRILYPGKQNKEK